MSKPALDFLYGESLLAATPFSADKTRWGQVKVENTYGSMESTNQKLDIDDTVVWF
ncbi:hypothetical protein R3X26_18385 [Vibrio sp. TH_r3]|uniref:hypothetical protein n=1 Tax=Vibrio sp. TH_r3 TaxID=3082084 RepID=UPI0029544F4E|nr:hypothetical protein [Vibrio sp. TH_r3]MDV7106356.1 hypothetical protein [Vibrio sp. TH_r3]